MHDTDSQVPRAFITCAARSAFAVGPVVAEVERILQSAGWRTRLPRRIGARDPLGTDDRRRLRLESYREIEHASVLIHVPAPDRKGGTRLHRELAHAVRIGLPILIVAAQDDRARLGVGAPSGERIAELVRSTGGRVVERLGDIPALVGASVGPRLIHSSAQPWPGIDVSP